MRFMLGMVSVFLLIGCAVGPFSVDEAYQRLEDDETIVYQSKEFGSVQYKIVNTNGIPLLVVHGITGGYDQGLLSAKNLFSDGLMILSVSRFGYLESDMPDDPSPLNQCKAYVELLNELRISNVFMMATSAGGTIALTFALHYPEYLSGLILVSSGYPQSDDTDRPSGPPRFVYSDGVFEFMLNRMPEMMMDMFGVSPEEFEAANESDQQAFNELLATILPIKPRREGIFNDAELNNPYMILHYDDYPLERIETPVLILHAEDDTLALYSTMTDNAPRFPNATVVSYESGGHVLFGHDMENRESILDFIKQNSSSRMRLLLSR